MLKLTNRNKKLSKNGLPTSQCADNYGFLQERDLVQ